MSQLIFCHRQLQVFTYYNTETVSSRNILGHSCYLVKGLDPYALVTCEGKTVRTPTLSDTANPEWNSGALFFVRRPKKTHLVIQVLCRCFYQ